MNHIDRTFKNDQMLECFSTVGTLMWPFSHMIDYGKNRIFSGILLSGRLVNQEKFYMPSDKSVAKKVHNCFLFCFDLSYVISCKRLKKNQSFKRTVRNPSRKNFL